MELRQRTRQRSYSATSASDGTPGAAPSNRYITRLGTRPWLAIGFVVAATLFVSHRVNIWVPHPLEPDAENTRFSELRAFGILNALSDIGPKPAGSPACEETTLDLLKREVTAIKRHAETGAHKVDIEVQRPSGCFVIPRFDVEGFGLCYRNVSNLVVRLSAKNRQVDPSRKTLLVNCHFDSWPTSPAASDDLAACAISLELLRILGDSSKPALSRDVIFLFNAAEESSLLAAHGFITQHEQRHAVGGFVNLEACGSGGREILFQAGPATHWLLDAYIRNAPRPHLSVLGQEVFQGGLIPSDTDFRVFRDHGHQSGLDFAFAQNGYWWHTEFDEARRISPGSLQHAGENVLAVIRHVGEHAAEFDEASAFGAPYFVFFDVFNVFVVVVSYPTTVLAAALATTVIGLSLVLQPPSLGPAVAYPFAVLAGVVGGAFVLVIGPGKLLHARLLWLSFHSAVLPLYILPLTAGFIFVIQFVLFRKHLLPESRFQLAWSLFQGHNVPVLLLTWFCLYKHSATAFFLLIQLLPAVSVGLLQLYSHLTGAIRPSAFTAKYYVSAAVASFVPVLTVIGYTGVVTLTAFIPIMGRSKGNTDLVVYGICALALLCTLYILIPVLAITEERASLKISRRLLTLVVVAFLGALALVPAYHYTDAFPTVRRTQIFHVKKTFYDSQTSTTPSEWQELHVIAWDYREVDEIPIVQGDDGFQAVDCTGKGRFCRLPFLFPTPDRLGPRMLRVKNITDDTFDSEEASAELLEKTIDANGRINYVIRVKGSGQTTVAFTPSSGHFGGWRLRGDSSFAPNATFAFLTCTFKGCGDWVFEASVDRVTDPSAVSLEVLVSAHNLFGDRMKSDTIKRLEDTIARRRKSKDWHWAMTASAWNVHLLRRVF